MFAGSLNQSTLTASHTAVNRMRVALGKSSSLIGRMAATRGGNSKVKVRAQRLVFRMNGECGVSGSRLESIFSENSPYSTSSNSVTQLKIHRHFVPHAAPDAIHLHLIVYKGKPGWSRHVRELNYTPQPSNLHRGAALRSP